MDKIDDFCAEIRNHSYVHVKKNGNFCLKIFLMLIQFFYTHSILKNENVKHTNKNKN